MMNVRKKISDIEFVALMALLMSNVALSIDSILPALSVIGKAIQSDTIHNLQYIVSVLFLGLGIGQLIFGTLSDSFGRKPMVIVGVFIFIIASFICIQADSLSIMLIGRALQGLGLAAPKTISISIVRDSYKSEQMARIISYITLFFIAIPMIAPILGQLIMEIYDWKAIFYFQLIVIFLTIIWFYYRQNETLAIENRKKLTSPMLKKSFSEFFNTKSAVNCTLISALIEGVFIAFISNSKQIFQNQYLLVDEFPYVFGGISIFLGLATFLNASLVLKYDMKNIIRVSLFMFVTVSFVFLSLAGSKNPSVEILIIFFIIQFFFFGFIFGNISAIGMENIGHIAGFGASIFSFVSTSLGALIAVVVGMFIEQYVFPLFLGFVVAGVSSLILLSKSTK